MSITPRNFARITKTNLRKRLNKKKIIKNKKISLVSKGHWVVTLWFLSEKAKCCSSFSSAACSLPGYLPEEAPAGPSSVRAWLGSSGPPEPASTDRSVCHGHALPGPIQSQRILSLYSRKNACSRKHIYRLEKKRKKKKHDSNKEEIMLHRQMYLQYTIFYQCNGIKYIEKCKNRIVVYLKKKKKES